MTKIFGWIAASLGLMYKMPQMYKIYKYKKTEGLSLRSYIFQSVSYCFYIIHGFYIEDNPSISMGFISLVQNIIIHILFYKFKDKKDTNNDNNENIEDNTVEDTENDIVDEVIV
jgi:uncharacterized protein with PQ loop repeat